MAAPKVDCPFCDWPGSKSVQEVVYHLLGGNCGERKVNNRSLRVVDCKKVNGHVRPRIVECWCGKRFKVRVKPKHSLSQFARHLHAEGGLAGHVLQLTFLEGQRDD